MADASEEKTGVRLVKYLAQCGVASRRGAGDIVQAGRVIINDEVVINMAYQVQPTDQVFLDGKLLNAPATEGAEVILLNKPDGVVCSLSDPHNPRTVLDCLPPDVRRGLKPVGRLDKDTTGLLLLTSDGDLINKLTHPRYGVCKTYRATVTGKITEEELDVLQSGMMLEDGPTASAEAKLVQVDERSYATFTTLDLTIHEGRNRQVRRMFDALGHQVRYLERIQYGPLRLEKMKHGAWRKLTEQELEALRQDAANSTKGT
ncbi:TPA: pseudouridine synthase [Candidatus Sumerlaeota bacterium]|jgi:23S rRNA pseudouridine2605 synthase|nr:pseudouridine synthase [Candidatus Sumerlaeota bacterium]